MHGADGIRTHDPLVANQVLSQLSYRPADSRRNVARPVDPLKQISFQSAGAAAHAHGRRRRAYGRPTESVTPLVSPIA